MAKKDFKTNPVMNFISQESIDKVEGKPEKKPGKKKAPEGYKPNPEYIEVKSRRVQILLQPSIHEAIKAKAKAESISTNEAINEAIKKYVEG